MVEQAETARAARVEIVSEAGAVKYLTGEDAHRWLTTVNDILLLHPEFKSGGFPWKRDFRDPRPFWKRLFA